MELDLTQNKRLGNVRDAFCFTCFTGVRYSDFNKIKFSELSNNTWKFRATKTSALIEIPIPTKAMSIIAKYYDLADGFHIISDQKMNDYIKEVCKLAGITNIVTHTGIHKNEPVPDTRPKYQYISTRTARRTFITQSLERGMSPDIIMMITRHHDVRMILRYTKRTNQAIKQEMEKAWGKWYCFQL